LGVRRRDRRYVCECIQLRTSSPLWAGAGMEQTVGEFPFRTHALRDGLTCDETELVAFRPVHSSGTEGKNSGLAGHFGQVRADCVASRLGWAGWAGRGFISASHTDVAVWRRRLKRRLFEPSTHRYIHNDVAPITLVFTMRRFSAGKTVIQHSVHGASHAAWQRCNAAEKKNARAGERFGSGMLIPL